MRSSPLRVMMVGSYPEGGVARGGVESATEALVQALARRDDVAELLVVSLESREERVEESHGDKVRVVRVPAQRFALLTRGIRDLAVFRNLARSFDPDVVHGQGIGRAGDIAARLGTPFVLTVHGMAHIEERALVEGSLTGGIRVGLVESMVRRVLSRAHAIINISEYDRTQLPPPAGIPSFVVPNAVRREFFDEPPGEREPFVLYAGGVIRRKNAVGLVRAFRGVVDQVDGARLVVAGGAPDSQYETEVHEAARSLGNVVSFLGPVDSAQLVGLLGRARCLALFSHQETLPCAIAEAFARGTPVVATDVGGVGEMVVEGATGYLIADGDEHALTSALVRCLAQAEESSRMGHEAAVRARAFHPDSVAEATMGVYHVALERSEGS